MELDAMMNDMRSAIGASVMVALVAAGCSQPAKAAPEGRFPGKLSAPVAVEAELGRTSARVTLRFEVAATEVTVQARGLDGLAVRGESALVAEGTFKQGDLKAVDVSFEPGAGRSYLAVSVSGLFHGAHLARVVTFAVGMPTPEQQQSPATVFTGDDGVRVKGMKVN